MPYIIIILVIACFVIAYFSDYSYEDEWRGAGITIFIIGAAVSLIITFVSYMNYMELREYKEGRRLEHDVKAIQAYQTYIDSAGKQLLAETRDEYYKKYYSAVTYAKNRIIDYNENIISKRIWADNWMFSIYIIEPDPDMVLINPEDYDYK